MSVNNNRPHIFVLPEDDANRQLANGFWIKVSPTKSRQLYVQPVAGGWPKVRDQFVAEHVDAMRRVPDRLMILLIDFDEDAGRLRRFVDHIPEDLRNRVFVIGSWTNPEALKASLGRYEDIGAALADDCRDESANTWDHHLLRHNATEIGRLSERARAILFD